MTVASTWAQDDDGPLAAGYTHLAPLPLGGKTLLLAVAAGGAASAFSVDDGGTGLTAAGPAFNLGADFDLIESFVLGNATYLLAYTAATGHMSFFSLSDDLTLGTSPYTFYRTRPPSVSTNFTVVKPIVVAGLVYILGYSGTSGAVDMYSLEVTATPQPGTPPSSPPLLATPVWDHRWAKDWTHFAFFTLGAENFFFKINTGRLNVNVDHVLDTPSLGTIEVGTSLQPQLQDALALDVVRSFTLGGDPYFVTYKSDGTTVVRRFRGDCQGWNGQASLTTVAGATQIVSLSVDDEKVYALFY